MFAKLDLFNKFNLFDKFNVKETLVAILAPLTAFAAFLFLWNIGAAQVKTSLGQLPGPVEVAQQAKNLWIEHKEQRARAAAFYERQKKRNAQWLAKGRPDKVRYRAYTGKPTFFDQVFTSIYTVLTGFLAGALIAIPIGIVAGLSDTLYRAINPIVQIFKPVSPLAWLPLVTMVVSAVYVTDDPMFSKSFLNSAITVTLCCLWPTLISTAVGVSSVDKDHLNLSRVLRLGYFTHIRKIVLPNAIPMIFTGLRLSIGIGWMVLIAAEMLAQNPGLGKFVWDEFQNGSSHSLGRIMVAVLVIGLIGFLLDRSMLILQRLVSWDKSQTLR